MKEKHIVQDYILCLVKGKVYRMLRIRVYINTDQIDDVVIINRGLIEATTGKEGEGYYLYEVFRYRINREDGGMNDSIYINHKREDGWEPLVAKAVSKLKENDIK
jgi:hypothetical protein